MSLRGDKVVQAAVGYALLFGVDPMAAFLDRPEEDLPVLLAVMEIADRRLREGHSG